MSAGAAVTRRRTKVMRAPTALPVLRVGRDLRLLADYWDLLVTLSIHRLKVRYKQSVLGWAWAVLQPVALVAIYTVIFSMVTRMPSAGMPYSVFAFSALLPWLFFSNSLTSASNALVSHSTLITRVYFPREIIPLTYVIAASFDLLIGGVVLLILMGYYGIALTPMALYAIPVLVVAAAFATALALLLSAIQVRLRDIGLAMPLILQVWMFASPVVYPLDSVPERFRGIYLLNPMAGIVENFRRTVLQGIPPDMESLRAAAVVSLVLLPLAFVFFKHQEATMADII